MDHFTGTIPIVSQGTLWRYRPYDFQAPGLPTTETYGQLDLSRSMHIDPER